MLLSSLRERRDRGDMEERVYTITGRVLDAEGESWAGVSVAVVDKDKYRDDLLGVGPTDGDGRFRLSFTESEFRQDLFETEETPDIYLVLSLTSGSRHRAVGRFEFFELEFESTCIDLGDVSVACTRESPVFMEKQSPMPGHRVANRLELTDSLVRYCVDEVGPLVESYTGWSHLADNVVFVIVDDMVACLKETLEEAGFDQLDGTIGRLALKAMASDITVLFEPFSRNVFINAGNARKQNFDAFKIILGHELVHVGQFLHHPELLEKQRAHLKQLWNFEDMVEEGTRPKWQDEEGLAEYIENLEGYAYYIQHDFLQKRYPMATFFPRRSFLGTLFDAATSALAGDDEEEQDPQEENSRLIWKNYRESEKDGRPAPFAPP